VIRGIFLDIDNTLISSIEAYKFALEKISKKWKAKCTFEINFLQSFEMCKSEIKKNLPNVPTNRNRILVFKLMRDLGLLSVSVKDLLELEEDYFSFFQEHIVYQLKIYKESYQKLFDLLKKLSRDKKIVLISNESLRTQLLKLSWFFPENIPYILITSEEVGIEKPSPIIFQKALQITQLQSREVVMLGDSLGDDVLGAIQTGIQAYWIENIFGEENVIEQKIGNQIIKKFSNLNFALETLLEISNYT
jgi:HAD superfamily hydrolase (TIGR01549 family)